MSVKTLCEKSRGAFALLLLSAASVACALSANAAADTQGRLSSEKGPATLANVFQGTWNTAEFSHGRCRPAVGVPRGNFTWSPSGLNYVDAKWSGFNCGLTFIPLASPNAPQTQTFDRDKAVGMPHYMSVTKADGSIGEVTALDCTAALRFSSADQGEKPLFVLVQGVGEGAYIQGRTIASEGPDGAGRGRGRGHFIVVFDRDFSVERRGRDVLLAFAPSASRITRTPCAARE